MRRIHGLTIAALVVGCAELTAVERDLCGNLIVEDGEICDGDDALGRCRPPGDPDACQYDCQDSACPAELLCGSREICWPPNVCGNGVMEGEEDCDGPSAPFTCRDAGQVGECRYDCTAGACPDGYKCLESGLCDDVNVCGNGTTEPENLEDCDGSPEGFVCNDPGTTHACRFSCSSTQACPDGFGCGLDGLCRRHSGTLTEVGEVVGASDAILGAELDGDGRRDIVQVSQDAFRTYMFDDQGQVRQRSFASVTAPPRVGDVDGDGLDDVVFRVRSKFIADAGELAVLRSDADASLTSLTHATENLPGVVFSIDAIEHATVTDLVMFDTTAAQGYSFNTQTDPGNDDNIVFGTTDQLSSSLPTSSSLLGFATDYAVTNPWCHTGAIVYRNTSTVRILEPCNGPFSFPAPAWNTFNAVTTIDMPSSQRPWVTETSGINRGGAVFFGDLDGNGDKDVIIPTTSSSLPTCNPSNCVSLGCFDNGSCDIGLPVGMNDDCVCNDCNGTPECNLCIHDGICTPINEPCSCSDCAGHPVCDQGSSFQVGYGLGDGSFDSQPNPIASDDLTSALDFDTVHNFQCPLENAIGLLGAPTLAVADLDGSGISDFVTGLGIYVSTGVDEWSYAHCPDEAWVEAVVGDLDGNGTADVLATSGGTTLDFLIGQGDGSFTPVVIGNAGISVHSLVSADFDGNGVADAAYIAYATNSPSEADAGVVMVAFGRQGELPADPTAVTRIVGEARLVAGRFLLQDGAADLAIVQPNKAVSFLRGSATKQFLSTFVFRESDPAAYATFTGVKSLEGVALGSFAAEASLPADTRTPIAALTTAADGSQHRVDLVALVDGAGLSEVRSPSPFDCNAGGTCPLWRLAAIDLLDDGQDIDGVIAFRDDELVVFDQSAPPTEVARYNTGINLHRGRSDIHGAVAGMPTVTDVDGDGLEDVAILGSDGTIHILWGDGALFQTMPSVTTVVSSDTPFAAFAFVELDPDSAGLELVTANATIALHRQESRAFGTPEALLDADGAPLAGGDSLVGGDFDGDGLDDLAIGADLSLRILAGVPALGGEQ